MGDLEQFVSTAESIRGQFKPSDQDRLRYMDGRSCSAGLLRTTELEAS